MTERFESIFNGIGLKDNETKNEYLYYCEDAINLFNDQHKTIQTLGIAITKILHAIKTDKEAHAIIMCIEVLKKLEEEGVELE